jgi:hypothetical protein
VDEEDPVKRLALLAGLAATGFLALHWQPSRKEAGVAGADSGPLLQRVSRTIRDPKRSPAAASSVPVTLAEGVARVHATRACLKEGNCAYPDNDAHEYAFAVARDLAAQAKRLREIYGPDLGSRGELEALARELMSVDDGYVQAEALRTFALYPPSPENLRAMLGGLENTYDPLIVKQALGEWRRYLGTPEEPLVIDGLAQLVARGGQFTGEAASADVDAFINERTARAFRETLSGMVPTSTAARNLRRALVQHDRQLSGG